MGTIGCRLDSDRRAARHEPARPNRVPQRTPSARGGTASSAAACGASRPSAVATRSHTRAARNLDMPSVSNAQSARQGRSRDDRNRRPHTIGVPLRMSSIACVHVCVRLRGLNPTHEIPWSISDFFPLRGRVLRAGPPGPLCFLFFVFSHPPTTSNAQGRPLTERSKTLGPESTPVG